MLVKHGTSRCLAAVPHERQQPQVRAALRLKCVSSSDQNGPAGLFTLLLVACCTCTLPLHDVWLPAHGASARFPAMSHLFICWV